MCDGVGAVDLPQRVHLFRFSLQSKALFSNVEQRRGIIFQLQLQACLRRRINIALQLQSGPSQELEMEYFLREWYLSLVNDEEVISLLHTKVYVFSDSVER